MNQQVSARRLLKLAEFLKTVPRKQFDYGHWVGTNWKGAPDLSCGTTACALGWATVMPFFRRLGLRLGMKWGCGVVRLQHSGLESLGVARNIFGLSFEEAAFLFVPGEFLSGERGPGFDATPKQVAAHIERFVRRRGQVAA